MVTLNGLGSQNQLNVGIYLAESWSTNFSLSTSKGNTRCLEHEKQGGAQQDLYAYDLRVYTGVHGYSCHFVICKDLQSNWPCFGFCDPLWLRSLGQTSTSMQRTNQAFSLMTRHDLPQIRNGGHCEWVQTSFSRAGVLPRLRKTNQAFSLMDRHDLPQIRNGGHCEWVQTLFSRTGTLPCFYKTQPSFQSCDPPWPTSLGMVCVNRPRPLSQGQVCCSASCWFSQSEFHWETQFLHEQLLPNPEPQSS